jgi:hypothetical protein
METKKNRILFEPRIEMRSDLAFIETFQDGSQLIRKRGIMIIVEECDAYLTRFKLRANLLLFSKN